jgi:hypothetical protein
VTWQLKPEHWKKWMRPLLGNGAVKPFRINSYASNNKGTAGNDVFYAIS